MTRTSNTSNLPADHRREVGDRFLRALVEQDYATMASCFSQDAQFRALVPRGLREARGPDELTRYFQGWFGTADRLDVLDSRVEPIADRQHLAWRLRVCDANGRRLIEQQAYVTVRDQHIVAFDLLCSGFRPD